MCKLLVRIYLASKVHGNHTIVHELLSEKDLTLRDLKRS